MIIKSRVRLTVNGHYDSVRVVYSSSDDQLWLTGGSDGTAEGMGCRDRTGTDDSQRS